MEKACKNVPTYHTDSLALHKKGKRLHNGSCFPFYWGFTF